MSESHRMLFHLHIGGCFIEQLTLMQKKLVNKIIGVGRYGKRAVHMLQFSDVLIYGSRLPPPKLQFRVHGQMTLSSINVSMHRLSV